MQLPLRCPRCEVEGDKAKLAKNMVCTHCGEAYKLKDGILDMLPRHIAYEKDEFFHYYDKEYAAYYHDLGIPDARYKARQALGLLHSPERQKVKSIIDIGCGPGVFLDEAVKLLPKVKLSVGTDLSSYIIGVAKKEVKGHDFVRADSCYLPFGTQSFDIATLIDVVEHVPDTTKLLSETKRVAKTVLVKVPLERCLFYWIQSKVMRIDWKKTRGHIHLYTKDSFLKLMEENGFTLIRSVVPRHPFPKEPFKPGILFGLYSIFSWCCGFLPSIIRRSLVITELIAYFESPQ